MKKFIPLLLALAGVLGVFALIHQKASNTHASSLVGEDTLLFIHWPDLRQSCLRWKQTSLFQISQEPDLREFLQKPKERLSGRGSGAPYLEALELADPREAFVALGSTSSFPETKPQENQGNPSIPGMVAGALCMGDKGKVEAALAGARQELQKAWPEGRENKLRHEGIDIETFTQDSTTIASAWVGRWILVGNDLELLKATIDRALGKRGPTGKPLPLLTENTAFQKSLAHMPKGADFIAFLRSKAAISRGLQAAGSRHPGAIPPATLQEFDQVEAICLGTKFEGENIRDAIFALTSGDSKREPQPNLTRQSLQLTTPDTLLYLAGIMDLKSLSEKFASLPALPFAANDLQAQLAAHGITAANITGMLGNEFGLILDWSQEAAQPILLMSLELKDPALAAKTVGVLTDGQLGNQPWKHTQANGTDLLTLADLPVVRPSLAIKADKLLLGLDESSVTAALSVPKDAKGGLQAVPAFEECQSKLIKPTHSFGYVDSKRLFERVYGMARPMLMLWGGLNPTVRNAVDVTKLPSTESISRHLTPIAYSSAFLPDGFMVESAGPVTFSQTLLGVGIGAGAALMPAARSCLEALAEMQKLAIPPATPPLPSPVP